MTNFDEFYNARNLITEILKKDFCGPVFEDECISENPLSYYISGKLYPQNNVGENEEVTQTTLTEIDSSISLSNQYNPSSIALTCTLKEGTKSIIVSGSYAFYRPYTFEEALKLKFNISGRIDETNKRRLTVWKRESFSFSSNVSFTDKSIEISSLENGMQLQVFTHTVLNNGNRVITVVLLNTNVTDDTYLNSAINCAFQANIHVEGENKEAVFINADHNSQLSIDPELLEMDMLYSEKKCYAHGHGCAVSWDTENETPTWVQTESLPVYDLKQMKAAETGASSEILSMKYLCSANPLEMIEKLYSFANEYKKWIDNLEIRIENLEPEFTTSAENNIQNCKIAYTRILHSIDLLKNSLNSDKKVIQAFQLANEAMLLQRERTLIKTKQLFDVDTIKWYPFQLAFILQELSSFIEPDNDERKLVDLLWFPTGGGKTEAYLGISAFVIFLRRLMNSNDDGVTVIMRYTLRLLTLQQFERASILIFACELLRKKYNLGGNEISIGLWVGGALTPNRLKETVEAIKQKTKYGKTLGILSDPCQLHKCPWCGSDLNPYNYLVDVRNNRMVISCPNRNCDFYSVPTGLPIHIIDEAIYHHLPSFVVATVDKFAQLPLNEETFKLLGISVNKKPPELIIQDELHLISGPLGTITGIYESAIEKLCEYKGIKAKVIASTATIRNAAKQIKALFGREYFQFPPQGISAKDSFFAVEAVEHDKPSRRYFGIMGIGTTATTTLIRVNAAILFARCYLEVENYSEKVINNFWTITDYFNNLRELGSASTQIMDDVQSRLSYLIKSKFHNCYPGIVTGKRFENIVELTGRMDNNEITKVIQEGLNRNYRTNNHNDVYDFLLASNMISVGVDVGRLGIMATFGQPKSNAEYIQTTSRIGRKNPGLVVTVFNPSKSRDRSHYEDFMKYHSAMYRYVEATSLTPFADRARDRGLQALYVTLCRGLIERLRSNDSAKNYNPHLPEEKSIKKMILDYVANIDYNELPAVRDELKVIENEWYFKTYGNNNNLTYRNSDNSLLKSDLSDDRFSIMNSMRTVDAQCDIFLIN